VETDQQRGAGAKRGAPSRTSPSRELGSIKRSGEPTMAKKAAKKAKKGSKKAKKKAKKK
jgi:hypothetical protein